MGEIVNQKEAARRTGISRETLRRWAKGRAGLYCVPPDGKGYDMDGIRQWLNILRAAPDRGWKLGKKRNRGLFNHRCKNGFPKGARAAKASADRIEAIMAEMRLLAPAHWPIVAREIVAMADEAAIPIPDDTRAKYSELEAKVVWHWLRISADLPRE